MARLESLSQEEVGDVMELAARMYEEEQAAAEETYAIEDLKNAAEELDIPPEYVDRAAELWQTRKVAQQRQRRQRMIFVTAGLGLFLLLGGVWRATHPPAPPPLQHETFEAAPAQTWTLRQNAETDATLQFGAGEQGTAAVIEVERFGVRGTDGKYFANLESRQIPAHLGRYHKISFQVQGAGLDHIRLYLEAGDERWRSPVLPVTENWQTQQLSFRQFDYQVRAGDQWRTRRYRPPRQVERFSFKTGRTVNPQEAHGQVRIDEIRFE